MATAFLKTNPFTSKKRVYCFYTNDNPAKNVKMIFVCLITGDKHRRRTGSLGFFDIYTANNNLAIYIDGKKYGYIFLAEENYIYI